MITIKPFQKKPKLFKQRPKTNRRWVIDTLPPVFDTNCKILIIGTIPGPESRKNGFYYCNQGNRFWKAIEATTGNRVPWCICLRKNYLLKHNIALWYICSRCTMIGSKDKTIRNVRPNSIWRLLNNSNIQKVFCNGKKAKELYDDLYNNQKVRIPADPLSSSSVANRIKCPDKTLVSEWKMKIKPYI